MTMKLGEGMNWTTAMPLLMYVLEADVESTVDQAARDTVRAELMRLANSLDEHNARVAAEEEDTTDED
tara:strand:+ start:86 stop:289 length:204 start_codon:yes stop_codon:yes gene_type:complete